MNILKNMRRLSEHEEQIVIIALVFILIVFLWMLVTEVIGIQPVNSYAATATYGAEMFFQQLTANP